MFYSIRQKNPGVNSIVLAKPNNKNESEIMAHTPSSKMKMLNGAGLNLKQASMVLNLETAINDKSIY